MRRLRPRTRVHGYAREQLERDLWTAMVDQVLALLARVDRGETTAAPSRLRCLRALVDPSAPLGPADPSVGGQPEATTEPAGDAAPRPGGARC